MGGGPGPAAPGGGGPVLISKTWYYYNTVGNPSRVMTRLENPGFNESKVTSTGLAYAKNGTTVTYVFGEEWDEGQPIGYNITYAREFRYDTGRARYLNRELDPDDFENGTMTEVSSATTIWTDYDGDQPYGDFTAVPGSPTSTITEQRSFELGVATFDWSGGSPDEVSVKFYHSDMIGTTRMMTDSTGFELPFSAVYTAFGERVAGLANRYGYAGKWGYQTDETEDFPFQHVGARYYDPSIGRFLQRDPIGITGGLNVYEYVRSAPTLWIDPDGTQRHTHRNPKTGMFKKTPWWRRVLRKTRWTPLGVCGWIVIEVADRIIRPLIEDSNRKKEEKLRIGS